MNLQRIFKYVICVASCLWGLTFYFDRIISSKYNASKVIEDIKDVNVDVQKTNFEILRPDVDIRNSIYQYLVNISEITSPELLNEMEVAIQISGISKDAERYLTFEHHFPDRIPGLLRLKYPDAKWKRFNLPLLSSVPIGRLGNVMGEYATLFALKHIYNTSAVVWPTMAMRLGSCFSTGSIPSISKQDLKSMKWMNCGKGKSFYNYVPLELAAAGLFGPRPILFHDYSFEMQLFNLFKKEIKREFTFHDSVKKKVEKFLRSVSNQVLTSRAKNSTLTFIGIHARRTDYASHISGMFGGNLPGPSYYKAAVNYYKRKYNSSVFIVSSDDSKFVKNLFRKEKNVFYTMGTNACDDLATLIACNHSIISLGSFGFWSGYLSGGEVVYPDIKTLKEYRFTKQRYQEAKMKEFTPMDTI